MVNLNPEADRMVSLLEAITLMLLAQNEDAFGVGLVDMMGDDVWDVQEVCVMETMVNVIIMLVENVCS